MTQPEGQPTTEAWEEKLRERYASLNGGAMGFTNLMMDIVNTVRHLISNAKEEERKREIDAIENLKIINNPKGYDGNSLETACDHYAIGAETWDEIIRYEQGYDTALNTVIAFLSSNNPKP